MAVMLNPKNENEFEEATLTNTPLDVKPGVTGINTTMLVTAMIVGAGMWSGIAYAVHLLLQLISG